MKTIAITVILSSLAFSAWAEPFHLRHDATGKMYGPFSTDDGSAVIIGKTSFTLITSSPAESGSESRNTSSSGPVARALSEIILPGVDLRNASPEDGIRYVKEVASALNKSATPINIVTRGIRRDPFSMDEKAVTLQLTSVSALRVLEEICVQADLKMREDEGVLVMEPKD